MSPEDEIDATRAKPSLREAIAETRVALPTRGNRRLERLMERVAADKQVHAWWYLQQVGSERLGMSDHSWVHIQIVSNIALRILRLADRSGIEPAMVTDHGMSNRDAEVVVVAGAMLHDTGMSSTAPTTRPTASSSRSRSCVSCSRGSTRSRS